MTGSKSHGWGRMPVRQALGLAYDAACRLVAAAVVWCEDWTVPADVLAFERVPQYRTIQEMTGPRVCPDRARHPAGRERPAWRLIPSDVFIYIPYPYALPRFHAGGTEWEQ